MKQTSIQNDNDLSYKCLCCSVAFEEDCRGVSLHILVPIVSGGQHSKGRLVMKYLIFFFFFLG